jgi:hypothetical protein
MKAADSDSPIVNPNAAPIANPIPGRPNKAPTNVPATTPAHRHSGKLATRNIERMGFSSVMSLRSNSLFELSRVNKRDESNAHSTIETR